VIWCWWLAASSSLNKRKNTVIFFLPFWAVRQFLNCFSSKMGPLEYLLNRCFAKKEPISFNYQKQPLATLTLLRLQKPKSQRRHCVILTHVIQEVDTCRKLVGGGLRTYVLTQLLVCCCRASQKAKRVHTCFTKLFLYQFMSTTVL